ncbi:MAG TPA: methyltransferase domain-containing protein [Spirochaetia bacterium]
MRIAEHVTAREILASRPDLSGCEVEIGCGNGHFIVAYAAEKPGSLLVGIDIKEKRCRKAREKADKRGLGNVSIVHGTAESFLHDAPRGSVSAFHIYFPDPWPKSRHRKRRFFTMENLLLMHAALRPGGMLFFGTDFFDYYMQAKVLVALHGGFGLSEERAPKDVLGSLYGQKFVGAEKPIHIFSALRLPDEKGEEEKNERHVDGHVEGDEET